MNKHEVGKRLATLRGKKSQKEVATAIGISSSTLAMYETGRRMPKDENKVKLADYYGTTVMDIFFT